MANYQGTRPRGASGGSRSGGSWNTDSRSRSGYGCNEYLRSSASSGRSGSSRSPASGPSGISGFYKAMALLAVAGIFAAMYFGGHFSRLFTTLSEGKPVSLLFENMDFIDDLTSSSSTAAPTVETEPVTTTSTTARITTTAAQTTTATASATVSTTATEEVQKNENNAEYVDSPDYESPYYIVVFTGSQSVVVYGKDSDGCYNVKTKCFTCSTGASGTPTRTGMYSIIRTYRWHPLKGGVYGQYCSGFSSSYLFHSVLYDEEDNTTLYSNSYDNLGTAASHGCVRLCVRDAKWIYDNCPHGTQVHVVKASGPKGESDLPEIKSGSRYSGWEPTDPDENNPYNN